MKTKIAIFSVTAALLLSGCNSSRVYYEVPVPQKDVGRAGDDGWKPYAPAVPERRPEREWQPRNPDWGSDRRAPREAEIRREPLADPEAEDVVRERPPVIAPEVKDEKPSFTRAEPKDPPTDPTKRRTYSSRPDRNAALNGPDGSAFSRPAGEKTATVTTAAEPRRRAGVRSEWADKAVRSDNRASFDRMVTDSSRLGKGSFEDEAGRVYYGEKRGTEGGCTVVDVTVTTDGGLPVVARGLAYDCR